ncbi:hypothetical protein DEO72_LG7g886 [Vigna unguiculata]|uniref:23S rRNA (Pseudouridine1915-N3)-methyltransferase n=1 Tax=Vigna unguiculata TaxID=3917 RepID=A0A4D6MDS1_VIGUN|nr:hypothetical protein DEO72_LG7g886 [Vigna unguiculata]
MVDEYVDKLKYYCSVEDVQIRPNPRNASDQRAQVDAEEEAVMNLIRSDDWVVMLDERGRDIGSEQMAELVGDAGNTGASRISFCIGGPYGHGRKMKERANLSIKLSSLVLNHQIALLVLMEQLYRWIFPYFSLERNSFLTKRYNSGLENLILCLKNFLMLKSSRKPYCMLFDWNCKPFIHFRYCLIEISGFFPETAWWFNPYRQAAHQCLGFFWVLVYRLAVLSLPPGDDKDSGTRCCVGFGWLRGKRLGRIGKDIDSHTSREMGKFGGYRFSPFLFVYGDDRVIRYTGANVDTGGAEDVLATE